MMSRVRPADSTDIPWLVEQMREFDAFFGALLKLFPGADDAKAFIGALLDQGQPFFIAQNDVRTGFIAGTIGPHPYNPMITVLTELFWWVPPKYRGTSVGGRLLIAFEEFGRTRGAEWIVMTLEERTVTEGLINPESLVARGYRPSERCYLLELPKAVA